MGRDAPSALARVVIVVRYADDLVVGFQHRTDAERFLREFRERLAKFGLELHADKTRLIEFGRFAARDRKRRGEGKPETFTFLGFTHYCGQLTTGAFIVWRITAKKRMVAKLKAIKAELQRRKHDCDGRGCSSTTDKRDDRKCAAESSCPERHGIGSSPAQPSEAMYRPRSCDHGILIYGLFAAQ